MLERLRASARWVVVTVGVIVLTSFAVDATFSPRGVSQSALGIIASRVVPKATCPQNMVELQTGTQHLCVDRFEATPGLTCPHSDITTSVDTLGNFDEPTCMPTADMGRKPWVFISFRQARELCARSGKRLPTSSEWYELALGTPDSATSPVCVTSGTARSVNSESRCVTGSGVYNAIGNVWEWVQGDVVDGVLNGASLPESGYVADIDRDGIAVRTESVPNSLYYSDYFWAEKTGEYGILRGGFYGSRSDAGLYSVQAKTAQSFASDAIGFRCVKDL